MAKLEFAYKPVEIFGHSGSSLNVQGGTIQVNTELASGTVDVSLGNSTVVVDFGGTVESNKNLYIELRDGAFGADIFQPTSDNKPDTVRVLWSTGALYGYNDGNTGFDRIRVQESASGGTIPTGLLATAVTERSFDGIQEATSTTTVVNGTVQSQIFDIRTFQTKTFGINSTASGTLTIQVAMTAGGTLFDFITDTNITANTFTTKSFTEAYADTRAQFVASTLTGTIDMLFSIQA